MKTRTGESVRQIPPPPPLIVPRAATRTIVAPRDPTREYDIYLPTKTSRGAAIPSRVVQRVKAQVLKIFGGYTHLSQPMEGVWKMGGVTFVEGVSILRVIDPAKSEAKIIAVKRYVQAALKQKKVLVVERQVRLL